MSDLPAVKTDLLSARATLDMMDAKQEDVYEFIDCSHDEVIERMKMLKLSIFAHRLDLSENSTLGG